jgi:hypothetical protein
VARRSILVAMAVAIGAAWPVSANAATAPSAPQLTTAPYVSPAVFQWTPGNDVLNVSQTVYRAPGACTTPLATGIPVRTYADNTTNRHFAVPGDGTFCFYVRATDLLGATANSPGLTLTIDTTAPTATVAVSGTGAGGVVSGTVQVSRTSSDATSGVASSVLRIGVVGECAAGRDLRSRWDTTAYTDGRYDVCNIVTDRAGYTAIASVTVTVANAVSIPVPIPIPLEPTAATAAAPIVSAPVAAVPGGTTADTVAPPAPTKLAVVRPRSRNAATLLPVTLRWVNPAAVDLARVVVVLNLKHPPSGAGDGRVVYSGMRASATFKLRAGQSGRLALYAYDRSGNVSRPARRTVSLASLIPLRPLTGSVVSVAPLLTWKAKEGTIYYNVQVFRNGRRVLVGWPSQASYRLPAYVLIPGGTYTWFVWPAVKHKQAKPTFDDLIGRATFIYDG